LISEKEPEWAPVSIQLTHAGISSPFFELIKHRWENVDSIPAGYLLCSELILTSPSTSDMILLPC
jgi:hypothetical protein